MARTKNTFAAGLTLALASALALSACSTADDTMDETTAMESTPAMTQEAMPADTMSEQPMVMDAYSNLVGAGCAAYDEAVPDGAGSVQGMSQDPVAVAASNNPLLTTLVAAVSGQLNPDVNLVDTLNGDEFTVFAPIDDAFAAIDPDTIEALKTDSATLSAILTYHVVPGQIEPDDIAGTLTTVNGADLTVTGSGDQIMVNGDASVICGGVQTANATVYLVDTVLLPPAN
ncbi:fasciclin domain-containing protein [Demequina sp.]|uniref:fasciclin domain-containing protein n=1 Tax=Demequina sp. TaxID=2050685 RepID=UPI0025F8627E|nr:fasciclin domain-containing protein [Demequina sp.]